MTSPLTVARNDYHKNRKNSTIYTPVGVAQFLFDILHKPMQRSLAGSDSLGDSSPNLTNCVTIFDPAIGTGRLTDPWFRAGHQIFGCDVEVSRAKARTIDTRFEDVPAWPDCWSRPNLVLCNPPFNGAPARQLYPELFLRHIFQLFGPQMPTVMFAPMGFRLNQRRESKRWRWLRDCGAEITSIVSLPLDLFEDVEFHAEILIFNIVHIRPHYCLPEEALR
jgi:hypothetical protein